MLKFDHSLANLALRLNFFFHSQLGIKFIMLINVKIPTNVDVSAFIISTDTASKSCKARKS